MEKEGRFIHPVATVKVFAADEVVKNAVKSDVKIDTKIDTKNIKNYNKKFDWFNQKK